MENIALLGSLVYKYGLLAIAIFGSLRWILTFRDGKGHWITKTITVACVSLSLYMFIGRYFHYRSVMEHVAGDFKVRQYNCEKCSDCVAKLKSDGSYLFFKNSKIVDSGKWSFEEYMSVIDINIRDGSQDQRLDTSRTLFCIKIEKCQNYWRNKNLIQALNGIIVSVDSAQGHYGRYAFTIIDPTTKKALQYVPLYMNHPWLNGKLTIGSRVKKASNSLTFEITSSEGKVSTISEQD